MPSVEIWKISSAALCGCDTSEVLSHLEAMAMRILFPQTGFTTADLVETYTQLGPALLPHLVGRPLTLKRFPEDIHHESFWEKDAPSFTPKWIERLPIPRKHESGVINYIGINNLKALRWAASLGCVEIHSFLHRYSK